ncbi:MAG: dUTP diphosphatase [Bacilli bacterium]|nr:dUTP diphosphatase [Bacillales bacterium]MDY2745719.1 dUTP diphosphatase [Bacilli bacterium]MDY3890879.1 dUTP diphosphatase [Bacilli bacterium]
MLVRFKKINPNASIPTYGSSYAAGCDLSACIDQAISIPPHTTIKVPTGLAIELPENTVGLIYARSGMATKRHLAPANKVGVIDADYRGEIIVALHNHSEEAQTIEVGERIAQLVVAPFYHVEFEEVDELSETVRGEGGFGSTGTK